MSNGRATGARATKGVHPMNDTPLPANLLIVGDNRDLFDGVLAAIPAVCPFWQTQFAADAASAARMLDTDDTIDAVIVQARLADSEGLQFLESVRDSHPHLARILVAAQHSPLLSKDLGSVAHEVVAVPFNSIHFVSVVEAAVETQRRVTDPALQSLLSGIDTLPSPPRSVLQLNELLRQPDSQVVDIAHLVDENVAITAKLLRVVNSAYFGLNTPIGDTAHAISYLGLETVRTLVGGLELINALQPGDAEVVSEVENLQAHSLAVAGLAQSYMPTRQGAQDAYVAGMLHDVGLLALVSCAPAHYLALREEVVNSGRPLLDCEFEIVGATHTAMGAYVLGLWGFPSWLVEAVSCSHDADKLPEWVLDVTSAVFVAEQVANAGGDAGSWEGGELPSTEYLDALGLTSVVRESAEHQTS
jgi:HD-like signal output (HDOD) protein